MSDAPDDGSPAPGTPRRERDRPRLAVVALAVGVRLVAAITWTRQPQGPHDPALYQWFARGIARGDGYVTFRGAPTSYYPPGYPGFLGGLRWLLDRVGAGEHLPMTAAVVQALLAGVTAWALVGIGDRIDPIPDTSTTRRRWRAGIAAATVFACWPNLVLHSTVLLSENVYVPLFAGFLLVVVRALQAPPDDRRALRTNIAVAGVLLGAAALVRPQIVVVVAGLALGALLLRRSWPERAAIVAVPLLVAGAVVAPWTIRNVGVFDRVVAVSTNGGDNMCVGFHPGASGAFEIPPSCQTGEFYMDDGPAAEARRNAETARRARTWAVHHLRDLPALSVRKLWYTYRRDDDGLRALESYEKDLFLSETSRSLLRGLSDTAYLVILIGATAGAVIAARRVWRRRRVDDRDVTTAPLAFVLVATLASAAVPVLVFGDPRFKVPATPGLAVLAGIAAVAALRPVSSRPPAPLAVEAVEAVETVEP